MYSPFPPFWVTITSLPNHPQDKITKIHRDTNNRNNHLHDISWSFFLNIYIHIFIFIQTHTHLQKIISRQCLACAHTDLGDIFSNFLFLNYFAKLYHATWLYHKLLQGVHYIRQSYEHSHIFPWGASFMLRFPYLSLKFPLFPHPSNSFHHQPRWTPQSIIFPTKASLFKHCSRRPLFHGRILFHFSSTNTQTPQDENNGNIGACFLAIFLINSKAFPSLLAPVYTENE